MVDRFSSMLDCVDIGFLPDGILDQLPAPSTLGRNPDRRHRHQPAPQSAPPSPPSLALAVAPEGFTVAEFTAQVQAMTGQTPTATASARAPTTCASSAANSSSSNPAARRRYHVPGASRAHHRRPPHHPRQGHRAPSSPASATPRRGRPPKTWTNIDRDYETLRLDMQTLFDHLAITTPAA